METHLKWNFEIDFIPVNLNNSEKENLFIPIIDKDKMIICLVNKETTNFRYNVELISKSPELIHLIHSFVNEFNTNNGRPVKFRSLIKQCENVYFDLIKFKTD